VINGRPDCKKNGHLALGHKGSEGLKKHFTVGTLKGGGHTAPPPPPQIIIIIIILLMAIIKIIISIYIYKQRRILTGLRFDPLTSCLQVQLTS